MTTCLDIADVARLTGLTPRALRFYEARGLLRPLRSEGGRRVYGAGELARLHAIVALKRAGFSLADIGRMLAGRVPDLGRLVAAQLAEVERRQAELGDTRALLRTIQSRIDRGEPIDVATLCSLIKSGDQVMEPENWRAITDRYLTGEEKEDWRARVGAMPAGFDQDAYMTEWKALSARIEAALPLPPGGAEAQAFVDEWFALLKPFSQIATPAMWAGAGRMYERMEEWEGQADPGFSAAVYRFIQEATRARFAAGGSIEGPPWMTGGPPEGQRVGAGSAPE